MDAVAARAVPKHMEFQDIQLKDARMQTISLKSNPDRHNILLGQFRFYWNIFQFFAKLDETARDSLIALHAGFQDAIPRFKQCRVLLIESPDSEAVHSQLDVLEQNLSKLRHGLDLIDASLSVDRIRRAYEGTNQAA